jgi:hypothetical protein
MEDNPHQENICITYKLVVLNTSYYTLFDFHIRVHKVTTKEISTIKKDNYVSTNVSMGLSHQG